MVNKCCIHQPEHLPYIGFFAKLMQASTWIVFDTAQYQKNHFHNRNRIALGQSAWQWLTVPVKYAHHRSIINTVYVADEFKASKYLRTLSHAYGSAPYFNMIFTILESIVHRATKHKSLLDFNLELTLSLMSLLGIRPSIVLASSLENTAYRNKTERLIKLCNAVSSKTYVCGSGSALYMEYDKFAEAGIAVKQISYSPVPYKRSGDYIPYLSIVDLLMHHNSPEATEIIVSSVNKNYG